ncbi:MAG: hypothetical protein HZB24_00485 [Desulfobacterales bacterium]|nr:hypothetical protein [Desulfobacterales bacterium]
MVRTTNLDGKFRFCIMRISYQQDVFLLISEAVEFAAVGALPGYVVARHAPDILLHAALADFESAAAAPAEGEYLAAAMALLLGGSTPAPFAGRSGSSHTGLLD